MPKPKSITAKVYSQSNPITVDMAIKLLGWKIVDKKEDDVLLKDSESNSIRCENNLHNRPLYMSSVYSLRQEILRRRWRLNGEPIIIGKNGSVLNGQHSLIALVLAGEEYQAHPELYPDWEEIPYIEKVIVKGVEETDAVVNTMDTCKPRSLTDVIYRSEYFADVVNKDRKALARYLDYGVRLLWERTGASTEAHSIKRTHSEALDFISRHPKLIECIKFIYEENGFENSIGKFIGLGYAAGLMYLMACGSYNSKEYAEVRTESVIDFPDWEMACDFFVELSSSRKFKKVRDCFARLIQEDSINLKVRQAILIRAWLAYRSKKPINDKALDLQFYQTEFCKVLAECPVVGGIDQGFPIDEIDDEEIIDEPDEAVEDEESSKLIWVVDENDPEASWQGTVVATSGDKSIVQVAVGFAGAGKKIKVKNSQIQKEMP